MRRVLIPGMAIAFACTPSPPPAPPTAALEIPKMPASTAPPPPPVGHEPEPALEPEPADDDDEPPPLASPTPTAIPMPTAIPAPAPTLNGPPFDKGAAAASLGKVNVAKCKRANGPTGPGHVTLTFAPATGTLSSAVVDAGPYPGTTVGACIVQAFRTQAKVPPFGGAPVRVGKSFVLP
ncbi:MAG: hypothetical protein KIT84_13230 [Labilithrix sp.]|nr:hypothetical protein [Labilithrix sp.]MCW5811979.1 hypothetical protein [Labilithrix sp.]